MLLFVLPHLFATRVPPARRGRFRAILEDSGTCLSWEEIGFGRNQPMECVAGVQIVCTVCRPRLLGPPLPGPLLLDWEEREKTRRQRIFHQCRERRSSPSP